MEGALRITIVYVDTYGWKLVRTEDDDRSRRIQSPTTGSPSHLGVFSR